ncbi:hypothetical protein MATL_G00027720 [Megalops atlanticus]|uniref:TLDc domain-containing protein n=1 Tax=Megalops atlanticus TaxID=7932 RepID=A0A9D3QCB8_MEGAT|nr:hypothetical protein MATL_G00027720 [Megalops atlanticus]
MSNWRDDEIRELLSVRADPEIVKQIQGTARDSVVYDQITNRLRDRGVFRAKAQVNNKLKALKRQYHQVVDDNGQSGNNPKTWCYFSLCDAIWGSSYSTNPVALVGSMETASTSRSPETLSTSSCPETPYSDTEEQTPVQNCKKKMIAFSLENTKEAPAFSLGPVVIKTEPSQSRVVVAFGSSATAISSSVPASAAAGPSEEDLNVRKGDHSENKKFEWGLQDSPWRKVDWTEEKRNDLMQFITSYKPSCESVPEARVLLLGPVGAGKSSFISSVHSVFSGRVTNRAMVGSSSTSFTQKLRSYTIRGRGESADQPTSLVFCDVMGLGEGEMSGLTLHDTLAIIKGHAPEGHKCSAEHPVRPETAGYVKKPSEKEGVHCVAFVVDASKIDSYSKGMGNTFRQLREHISDLGVHQVALLTHVDKVCQETARDITKVYRSRLLQHTMEKAGALLGMCTSYIVPVKNYSSSTRKIIKSVMSVLSSNLSSKQEKQLCALFEHGRLQLIYKASVHGYSAANFHQKCDHQGPTITVAYNKAGFVFGGYTSKNYAQTGQNVYDDKAFLFSIRDRNIIRVQATNPQYAFTDANNAGPNFAGDLIFLYQNTAAVYSNPGNYYNFNAAEMHGNDLQLTECEVYRVEEHDLLDKPWRNIEWDSARRKELVDSIKNYKPSISSVDQARVVLIGPIGAGKSSFFNSINSIFQGHVTCRAMCGSAGTSLTTQFRTYSIKAGKDGKPLPIILCDTMGLEENTGAGLDVDDITNILKGHVPDRYQFNPSGPLQSEDDQFRKSVDLQDKIHCVSYVMDCCKVTLMSSKLEEKLVAIRKKVNRMAIPQLVLLTKVDEACSCVADDIENVYRCQYIERKIQEVSVRLGIPVSCVVPVRNYSRELELEPGCDVLLLSAMQQMLRFADNYFDDACE